MQTPFEYMDGTLVNIYIMEKDNGLILTDLDITESVVSMHGIELEDKGTKGVWLQRSVEASGSSFYNGEIYKVVRSNRVELNDILKYCETLIKVADISWLGRQREKVTFRDEVKHFLSFQEIPTYKDLYIEGFSSHRWKVDIGTHGKEIMYLIKPLSSKNDQSKDNHVSRTIRMWVDIQNLNRPYTCLTVLDNKGTTWRVSWIKELEHVSKVVMWSNREELSQVLVS